MRKLINDDGKVVSFTLFKIEKGRQKLCRCNPPRYEIDTVNRIVTCTDCGATLDAFDALMNVSSYIGQYEEYQREAIEKINTYRKMAETEFKRRMKNKIFKDMDKSYQNGLLPHCPECGEVFEPTEIKQWSNKKKGT